MIHAEAANGTARTDPRRRVPRTDTVMAEPRIAAAAERLGVPLVRSAVSAVLQEIRNGEVPPEDAVAAVLAALPSHAAHLRPVINATGVLLHTNLGRAPLSTAACEAMVAAAGCTDVEYDLATGRRAKRGRHTLAALAAAVPDAGAVHVVNNNAAALVLAATALTGAGGGREIVISRGELVEIGDGFRIPELLTASGARLREVGTTNRTSFDDYAGAIGPDTAFILKIHPSNYRIEGFTAEVPVRRLTELPAPVVVDIGSGLLRPEPQLPDEPDASTVLRAGADLVTASGDKLLGGPQAGLLLGRAEIVERLRRHPIARALRVDKLTLAALEATLIGPATATARALAADIAELSSRAEALATALVACGVPGQAVASTAAVGGGGAPGVRLQSAAVSLPEDLALPLRQREPAIVGRVERGRLLLDLRTVEARDDEILLAGVCEAAASVGAVAGGC